MRAGTHSCCVRPRRVKKLPKEIPKRWMARVKIGTDRGTFREGGGRGATGRGAMTGAAGAEHGRGPPRVPLRLPGGGSQQPCPC